MLNFMTQNVSLWIEEDEGKGIALNCWAQLFKANDVDS